MERERASTTPFPIRSSFPRARNKGSIPVTFIDDSEIETNRAFHINVVGRYSDELGIFKPANPLTANIEGDITIFDDDTPPIGPPVTIILSHRSVTGREGSSAQ